MKPLPLQNCLPPGLTTLGLSTLGLTTLMASLGILFTANAAQALSIVTDRAVLGGNDFIDWGPQTPDETSVNGPFTITSNGGVTATVSAAVNPMVYFTQDRTYFGGFSRGERLLATRSSFNGRGPITMSFATPISAGGLQIESMFDGDNYTASIETFDAFNTSLGSFTRTGSSGFGGGNAIFLGVTSDVGISRLVYSLPGSSAGRQNIFAMNRFNFSPFVTTPQVPVPPQLLGTGLTMAVAGLKAALRKRAEKSKSIIPTT
jgi:hypothetical protein